MADGKGDTRGRKVSPQSETATCAGTKRLEAPTDASQLPSPVKRPSPSRTPFSDEGSGTVVMDAASFAEDNRPGGHKPQRPAHLPRSRPRGYWAPREYKLASRNPEMARRWNDCKVNDPNMLLTIKNGVWPQLRLSVQLFCRDLLPIPLSIPLSIDMIHEVREQTVSWSPSQSAFSSADQTSMMIFYEAWVWHVLHDSLFSRECKDKWRAGAWANFGNMLCAMQNNVEYVDNEFTSTFFEWRHHSTRMLFMTCGDHADTGRLKTILRQIFNKLILLRGPEYSVVEERLDDLATKAIELDIRLLISRRDIRVDMSDPETGAKFGFPFSEASELMVLHLRGMAGRSPPNGRPVAFIAEPLVRIYGEQKGYTVEDYLLDFFAKRLAGNYHVFETIRPLRVMLEPEPTDVSAMAARWGLRTVGGQIVMVADGDEPASEPDRSHDDGQTAEKEAKAPEQADDQITKRETKVPAKARASTKAKVELSKATEPRQTRSKTKAAKKGKEQGADEKPKFDIDEIC